MTFRGKPGALFKLGLIAVLLATYFLALLPSSVSAAQITSRSLTLQDRSGVGGSTPNASVNHQFTFTVPTSGTLGSIKFLYCTTASGTCNAPAGLTTASATLGTSTGAVFTSAVSTSANSIYITRTAASFAGGAVTAQLLNVHNQDNTNCGNNPPATNNCAFYVRISTFASTDTTGSAVDTGTVAASTATQITLTGFMPESLIFCTGATISTTSSIPDCSTATSGSITFPDFSPSATSFVTSQMAASTNADFGYTISYTGPTLTSGSNTVSPMTSATTSTRGVSQFGLNLVSNATPTVGTALTPAANGTNLKGQALTGYDTADTFKFTTAGDNVANSANGGAGPTDSQIYTVSYIVNANGAQAVGTYTTTLTYVCTATF